MIPKQRIDRFFHDQPPMDFVETDIKTPVHEKPPVHWHYRCDEQISHSDAYVCFDGMEIAEKFPEDGFLETSYTDFGDFLRMLKLDKRGANTVNVYICKDVALEKEEHIIDVADGAITVKASDADGVRRALVYLEDMVLRSGAPYLKKGMTRRKPFIKTRMTRCSFAPTSRFPREVYELTNNIDYYPDGLLNRFMHEGVNVLWIYGESFEMLFENSVMPEEGQDCDRHLEKLNTIVEKCEKYGIKVYLYSQFPWSLNETMAKKYPDVAGHKLGDIYTFCTRSERGQQHIYKAIQNLFDRVPKLAGYIDITMGEGLTTCASSRFPELKGCPRCSRYSVAENLVQSVNLLGDAVKKAKPDAEFVSWTYEHRFWNLEDIAQYVKGADKNIALMQNLGDMTRAEQLGKLRVGTDYWFSCPVPSERYVATAQAAKQYGKRLFAKTQIGNGFELASTPYVPAPGILFEKYRQLKELGTEGAMHCWYFGSYPSIMGKAAGELSFWEDFSDESAFLRHLAGIYWGPDRAEDAYKAWKLFSEGFKNFPLNVMFEYFGPMNDAPVWVLQLLPKNLPIPRTFWSYDPTDGDRIFECLHNGHTLDEAIILCQRMSENWKAGLALFERNIDAWRWGSDICFEQYTNAKCIDILIMSTINVLRFYKLRHMLGRCEAGEQEKALEILAEMESIVYAEMQNSRDISALCQVDNRLGYSPEAEGFKFFPKKLAWRIGELEKVLHNEFTLVRERIENGLAPLSYYHGDDSLQRYKMPRYHVVWGSMDAAPWEKVGDRFAFRCAHNEAYFEIEMKGQTEGSAMLTFEFQLTWASASIIVDQKGNLSFTRTSYYYQSLEGDKKEAERTRYEITALDDAPFHVKIRVPVRRIEEDGKLRTMKMRIEAPDKTLWCDDPWPFRHWSMEEMAPNSFGWLLVD